jgi:hypothetical protein
VPRLINVASHRVRTIWFSNKTADTLLTTIYHADKLTASGRIGLEKINEG